MKFIQNTCKVCMFLITALNILTIFIKYDLNYLLAPIALILLFLGIFSQTKNFRQITLFFLTFGLFILLYYEMPFAAYIDAIVAMTGIISIVVVMQLFSIPIEVGEYNNTIEFWLTKSFKKESPLFLFTMFVTNIFSSFLMFGTVPVMVSLFSKALKDNITNYQRFLATAIVRGYAFVLFWAPGAIVMLLVLQITRVTWFDLFIPGLLLSIIGLITSYFFEHIIHLNKPITKNKSNGLVSSKIASNASMQAGHIGIVVIGLLLLVAFFEIIHISSGTGKILLAGLIIVCIWIYYYRGHDQLIKAFHDHWEISIAKTIDFSVFFIAMGFFATALDKSGFLNKFQPLLQNSINYFGIVSIIIIPIVFIILSIFGIHPLILVVILGKILMSVALPISNVSISLILILSCSISFIVSPFAGMVLMTAKFLDVKPIEVAFKWNAFFCIIFLTEGIIFSCIWH